MKYLISLFLVLFAYVASATPTCAVFTADGVVKAAPGSLISVFASNASANDDILIYDNASAASGTVVLNALNIAAGTTVFPNHPATLANGAYIDLTTGGSMNVNICYY